MANPSAQQQAQDNNDQIRELQNEVFKLKALVSKACARDVAGHSLAETLRDDDAEKHKDGLVLLGQNSDTELWNRAPRGYYRQHTLFQFFFEVRPFLVDTSCMLSIVDDPSCSSHFVGPRALLVHQGNCR